MLFVHEVHSVAGDGAEEFDRLYRDEWLPAVAKQGGARLLWYVHQAHGAGPAYTAITVTGVESAVASSRAVVDVACSYPRNRWTDARQVEGCTRWT